MGKPLSEEQRQFISKYIVNATKKQAASITKAYQDFDRRGEKIKAEIAKLPDGDQRTGLQTRLNAAVKKGGRTKDGSAFSTAYDDMEAIKADARGAAKGYAASLSPKATQTRLDKFDIGIAAVAGNLTQADQYMTDLVAELRQIQVPPLTDLKAIEKFQTAMTKHQARWLGDIQAARGLATAAGSAATKLGAAEEVKAIQHEVSQLQAKADKKQAGAVDVLATRATASDDRAKVNGAYYDKNSIMAAFITQEREAIGLVRLLVTPQNREGGNETGDQFKHLQDREQALLDKAKQAYMTALGQDAGALDPMLGGANNPPGPKPRAKFVASDLVPDDVANLGETDIDDKAVTAAATKLGNNAKQFVQNEAARTPNSDKLFDVTMKSLDDLRKEIGGALGLTGDPAGWPPNSRKLVEEAAKSVKAAVISDNPNQVDDQKVKLKYKDQDYDVPQTISVNGSQFDQPTIIGKGGLGLITRYKGNGQPGQPETVVVKSTLVASGDAFTDDGGDLSDDAKKRNEMVTEMQTHRALMGGEAHRPPPNVLEMKGAAVGKDGSLHMVMENADAGDANDLGHAVSALTRAGLLPKAAQHALQQDTMLQAAKGLKAVHGLGMLHNDIKAVNFLIDGNGQVKAGDFGSAYSFDEGSDEKVNEPLTTPMYDWGSGGGTGKRNEKTDVYQLGCMLHGMGSELGVEQTVAQTKFASEFKGEADSGHTMTSLDRLRNAMLSEKPEDRPTLDGVLMSSYLNDARDTYGDADRGGGGGSDSPDMLALRKAIAAYSKVYGSKVGDLNRTIAETTGKLEREVEAAAGDKTVIDQKVAAAQLTIDGLQAKIDELNKQPAAFKLLDDLKKASAPFGQARGDADEQQWDFAYRKTMDGMAKINKPRPRLARDLRREIRGGADLRDQQESLQANPT